GRHAAERLSPHSGPQCLAGLCIAAPLTPGLPPNASRAATRLLIHTEAGLSCVRVAARRNAGIERIASFSNSSARKNTIAPAISQGHVQSGSGSLLNTQWNGGA